ncbi:FAD-dependent oxidoreductase [Microbacterium sp. M3]|uniref:FAD-dependent oxidoreductase n=1 Tax=Microbacterium arthrosphaerae TaxID=792652 RepID=A0ABU4GWX3_9MICO|nr:MULTISPECIES: FAD-dependent oxidoreductase [Microbacterium]MDW4571577.1 FAD-dependent oxidoreductase [Microbacterium arthrosphaerae]MDW7605432.1 FAD-dependent oxidoreductase [Microbacterium sp. M3]
MRTQNVEADITVVGGGLAGVCAAISAARLGKQVALVGNRPVLGGNSSSEVRVWVVGATGHGVQRFARESGVIGELYVENQYRNPEGNPIIWDEVVHDAVRAEPNIRLFLNTDVREVDAADQGGERVITAVHGWTMGSETLTTFRSPYFLDCTGDGLIGHLAGAEYRIGREAAHELGESWAPEEADGELLGSTILFYTKDLGRPVAFVAPDSAKDITQTPIPASRILRSGDSGAHYWWIEWGGHLDTVHDNETIRDELRSVIFGIWDYIKNSGRFDAETLDLEWVGALPGKREYRRFLGDHVLSQNDILDQVDHDDAVAFGGWSIDLHPVEGMYATEAGAHQRYSNGIYGIPFRSYYSRNVANLLLAGRDISASHVAFGSTRVMATCGAGGEAAGTGAALAIDLGVRPRELAGTHAGTLRQTLLRQDASVFGIRNADPDDLARRARVSASTTAQTLDPRELDPAAVDEPFALERDLGVLVPVDPRIDHVELLLHVPADTRLAASLWTTGHRQNAVPIDQRARVEVDASGSDEPQWVRFPLAWTPDEPENVVVVVEAADGVSVMLAQAQVPGILALPHRPQADGDANVAVDESESVIAWPAIPLRGRTPRVRVSPTTEAFSVCKAVGGYQRFYGGPNLWMSEPIDEDPALTLEWDAPQRLREVRLVFDDDTDVELNTLHHHRTPDRVFPELVRDYVVEAREGDAWRELVHVEANRRRQRVHEVSADAAQALRLRVLATNGAPRAHVVSIRVY